MIHLWVRMLSSLSAYAREHHSPAAMDVAILGALHRPSYHLGCPSCSRIPEDLRPRGAAFRVSACGYTRSCVDKPPPPAKRAARRGSPRRDVDLWHRPPRSEHRSSRSSCASKNELSSGLPRPKCSVCSLKDSEWKSRQYKILVPFEVDCFDDEAQCRTDSIDILIQDPLHDGRLSRVVKSTFTYLNVNSRSGSGYLQHQDSHLLVFEPCLPEH